MKYSFQGIVNLGVAENTLCTDIIMERVNDKISVVNIDNMLYSITQEENLELTRPCPGRKYRENP